jgi:hypothetical protein
VAGYFNVVDNYLPLIDKPETSTQGYVNSTLTIVIMICAIVIMIESFRRWYAVLVKKQDFSDQELSFAAEKPKSLPGGGCC